MSEKDLEFFLLMLFLVIVLLLPIGAKLIDDWNKHIDKYK